MSVLNSFTVDLEDYFQVTAFEHQIARGDWDRQELRVVESTQRILRLLEEHNVLATFFVLGWVADRCPDLIAEIAAAGHEIGSHTYWHHLVYHQTPDEFRDDLRRSRAAIQRAADVPVECFRAPSFSITSRSLWALDILVEEGYRVDSSIFPTRRNRGGISTANPLPHDIETGAGTICEFPLAVSRVGRWRFPVSGGGYFRLYPFNFTRRCLAALNRTGQPFSFYIHPWEVDPTQPRIGAASRGQSLPPLRKPQDDRSQARSSARRVPLRHHQPSPRRISTNDQPCRRSATRRIGELEPTLIVRRAFEPVEYGHD